MYMNILRFSEDTYEPRILDLVFQKVLQCLTCNYHSFGGVSNRVAHNDVRFVGELVPDGNWGH